MSEMDKEENRLCQARRGYILKLFKEGKVKNYEEARRLAYEEFPTKRNFLGESNFVSRFPSKRGDN